MTSVSLWHRLGAAHAPWLLFLPFFCGSFQPVTAFCAMPEDGREALTHHFDEVPRTTESLRRHLAAINRSPGDCNLMLQIALDYLSLADTRHWHYLERASDYLGKLLKAHPQDPFVWMNLGRAIGARALDVSPSTFKRLRWAREGFKHMDKAVRLNPSDIQLRLLRAETQLLAHPILRRGRALEEDASYIRRFMAGTNFNKAPNQLRARIHLFFGNFLKKRAKSTEHIRYHWEKAARLAAGSPLADEARARLRGNWQSLGYVAD